ncbi:diphosphomevalonate decarboxylase isoform X2 [Lepeophtheirus salmonis]|uniref:diphosphomevalonate decarboxylase isoform X2 n=1 Tax=Lepeophtheirus salmonis TaxID=72036 RepID=UPI001AE8C933|nr:diphosphomevalonate decarboxylase-like isoform X2 [Lepeophtheirus salmonis]
MSLISNVPSSMDPIIVTCIAPVNIAVIKYWGKRDEELILPVNDSFSLTLDTNEMRATTSIMASSKFEKDQIWLNGREESMDNPRLIRCLSQVRNKSGSSFKNLKIRICSENNFPTAAGLASSAAGYACLVYALCQLFEVTGDISSLARLGSGSACRSTLGGFVQWHMGKLSDGSDSFSETIYPLEHWSDIKVLICVVSDSRKKVPSSVGMKNGVKTSTLLKYRVEKDVPERMNRILEAVKNKDFERFAEIVMKDSNQFHAICMDTYPPNPYLNDTSHSVSSLVHQINNKFGKNMVCYTYDAGPNACLFMPSSNVNLVAGYIQHFFPPSSKEDFIIGKTISPNTLDKDLLQGLEVKSHPNGLKYLIATEIGDGPRLLSKDIKDSGIHLFDTSSGLPNKHN